MKSPQQIEAAARALGANQEAIYKWRQRGVPSSWQVRLMAEKRCALADLRAYAQHHGAKEEGGK